MNVLSASQFDEEIIMFTYNSFGDELTLVDLTNSSEHFYFDKINDFRQQKLNIMISRNIPNIFVKSRGHLKSQRMGLSGPDGKLCELFCEKLKVNCNFNLKKDIRGNSNLGINDVAFNPSPITFKSGGNSMSMYTDPVYFDTLVIFVKAGRRFTPLMRMTFYSQVDDAAHSLCIVVPFAVLMLCIMRIRKLNWVSFTEICSDILNFSFKLHLDKLIKLTIHELLVLLPAVLYGFFIVNTVLSILTSFYTTQPLHRPDINSLSEFDELACEIEISKEHSMKIMPNFKAFNWSKRLVLMNDTHRVLYLETTNCFIDTSRRANLIIRYQKTNRRKFHIIEHKLATQLYGYMVHPRSPYKRSINEIISNVMSSGLYFKWSTDVYQELFQETIFRHDPSTSVDHIPSSLQLLHIFWPMAFLYIASITSTFILFIEIYVSKRTTKKLNVTLTPEV